MKGKKVLALAAIVMFAFSCVKQEEKNFPDEPQIYYLGLNTNQIHFSDTTSDLHLYFRLQDGDGDIARDSGNNVFISEYRSGERVTGYEYSIPIVPDELRQGDWLEGTVTLTFLAGTLVPRIDSLHLAERKDTTVFRFYVKDEAGNISNEISSDTIYISE